MNPLHEGYKQRVVDYASSYDVTFYTNNIGGAVHSDLLF